MSDEPTYLKIEIPADEEIPTEEEDAPQEDEAPFVAEQPAPTAVDRAKSQAANAAKKAWDSNLRKKATGGMKKGATTIAAKSQQVVQERMMKAAEEQARQQAEALKTKIRETDWQHEAKQNTATGLRWLSVQLAKLAERFTPQEETTEGN